MEVKLAYKSSQEWLDVVLSDFNAFLQDHADCERKASAMAMSFVAKCPDKPGLISELIDTALEELVHFKQVYEIMEARGVSLKTEITQDYYVKQLIDLCRSGRDERLMDRLVVASVVEARGAERFKLIAENLKDPELARFYTVLYKSEEKHEGLFLKVASMFHEENEIQDRLSYFIEKEAGICASLPLNPALH